MISTTQCRALKESFFIPKLYFSHLVHLDIVTYAISTVMGVPANIVYWYCAVTTQWPNGGQVLPKPLLPSCYSPSDSKLSNICECRSSFVSPSLTPTSCVTVEESDGPCFVRVSKSNGWWHLRELALRERSLRKTCKKTATDWIPNWCCCHHYKRVNDPLSQMASNSFIRVSCNSGWCWNVGEIQHSIRNHSTEWVPSY